MHRQTQQALKQTRKLTTAKNWCGRDDGGGSEKYKYKLNPYIVARNDSDCSKISFFVSLSLFPHKHRSSLIYVSCLFYPFHWSVLFTQEAVAHIGTHTLYATSITRNNLMQTYPKLWNFPYESWLRSFLIRYKSVLPKNAHNGYKFLFT